MRLLFALLLVATAAQAQMPDFDPHVGAAVPRLAFREASMSDYLGGPPVVLVLGYVGCVNLCGTTLMGVDSALRRSGLRPEKDYEALFVSIDPRDEKPPAEH